MINTVTPVTVRGGRADTSPLANQSLELPGDWNKIQESRDASEFVLPVGTDWVARDVLGVSEEVFRISGGRCRVASCQCGRCLDKGHFPHVVLERGHSGRTYPVFGFVHFGPHVTQRVNEIHLSQNPNKKSMENNKRVLANKKAKATELQTERLDIIRSALDSNKFDWRGPNGMRTKA